MKMTCPICPHHCSLDLGQTGLCHARINEDDSIICKNYGQLTSIALDPVEKKPLVKFHPGKMILSVGSYGCNLHCPFCQNFDISQIGAKDAKVYSYTPEQLIDMALELVPKKNIGIAYTYNEPFISYEYVTDCAMLAHEKGLLNVLVTNGYVCEEPLTKILPLIDAMNIDLKGFTEEFYHKLGGDLETVKNTISISAKSVHVEVTTLIIPDENDTYEEMDAISSWLASVDDEIPFHVSAFFPRYKYRDRRPTPFDRVYVLADIARKKLKNVYTGNC